MRNWNIRLVIALFVLLLAVSLILTGCGLIGSGGDPYSAGQQAREQFNQATETTGKFVAGFCSAAPLPVAAIGMAVIARRTRRD